jgi:DivIVA domain-containing protein
VTSTDLPPHPPDVREEEVAAVLAAEFPIALRGYDRTAVDAYVQRVSRVVAELQAGRSPQSAVRYALEQVSEETRSILQKAHDTADAMTERSRAEAAQVLDEAEREAATLRAAAEREAAELRAAADRRVATVEDDVASIWQERERLVEDAREVAARLAELADAAAEREPPLAVELTEGDTHRLAPVAWEDDPDDDSAPPPALRAVPPPPLQAAPEPSLVNAPPPPSEAPGPLAFEPPGEADLGPLDEPAAAAAADEAAVPAGDTAEYTPPFVVRDDQIDPDGDDEDTAERPR